MNLRTDKSIKERLTKAVIPAKAGIQTTFPPACAWRADGRKRVSTQVVIPAEAGIQTPSLRKQKSGHSRKTLDPRVRGDDEIYTGYRLRLTAHLPVRRTHEKQKRSDPFLCFRRSGLGRERFASKLAPTAAFLLALLFVSPAGSQAVELAPINQNGRAGNTVPVPAPARQPAAVAAPATPARPAAAPSSPPLRPGEVLFNFQDADIAAVIKTVSQITGRNFLVDPRVKGKITIISTRPVPKEAVYQVFLSALKAQGFIASEGPAGIVKIIPVGEAKQSAGFSPGALPRGEEMITHTVQVQYGSAAQMLALLRPLMAPTSHLSVYQPGNTLIITDYASNIRNLTHIVEILDQQGSVEVTIIPLKHASALDIAEVLARLYPDIAQPGAPVTAAQKAAAGAGGGVTIMPDMRTNSLLIRSDNQGTINQLRDLIDRLDVPAKVGGNTRVVYLRNAEAVKLAEILRGLLAAESRPAAAVAARAAAAAKSSVEVSLIQADETTNSLIISAPDAVYNNLRAVIEKLDIRRAQVFVEALIAEITTDKATQFGFQWLAGDKAGGGAVGAITNFPLSGTSLAGAAVDPAGAFASAGGLSLAYVGPQITLSDGTTVRGLGALARALEEKNIANILSTPNLLTLDNTEAKIVVGQNVPFLTGSFTQTGAAAGSVNPFQTIERKDVGLTLKIKPQISEGGGVKLEIFQEASSVARATVAAQDLITNTRSLETTVIVEDGHTVVLGGLIEDNVQENVQSVPFLGRIPILGWLFKYREQKKTKTNLMVFLRPVIIRGPEDAYGFTASRYEHIRALEKKIPTEDTSRLETFTPVKPPPKPERKDGAGRLLGPPEVPDAVPDEGGGPQS